MTMDDGTTFYLVLGGLFAALVLGAWYVSRRKTIEVQPSTEIEPGPLHWAPARDAPLRFPIEPRRRALAAAVRYHWTVDIVYFDDEGNRTERTISPLQMRGEYYVRAFCQLRQDDRTFRLDRMQTVRVHAASEATCRKYQVD